LGSGNVIRLTCLDMFHPECVDVYAGSLPVHTALAGYVCPTCAKPIFPPDDTGPLAKQLHEHLSQARWAQTLVSNNAHSTAANPTRAENDEGKTNSTNSMLLSTSPTIPSPNMKHGSSTSTTVATATIENLSQCNANSGGLTVVPVKRNGFDLPSTPSPPQSNQSDGGSGIASRKPQSKDHTIMVDEEDEDKYKKRSVLQLFNALGLAPIQSSSKTHKGLRQTRIRLDTKRILVIIALITCLVTVIAMGMSLTAEAEETAQG